MTTVRNLYLVFDIMAITNEPLELDVWNLAWSKIVIVPTNSEWNTVYKSRITNMAMVRIFEIMTDKFNLDRICA
jgi:hypothetical protein